ncbi:AAA family ATPase [Streptomyces sp. HPF1205]|uniref:AAA family ATPase n=1 Tax=Streptomyces sp. HPF1205 TaxID=2873262 RepID=UPI001CEC2085|nr:LuxR family transcriptional regulator [Streptomyces sp. HPF1205]
MRASAADREAPGAGTLEGGTVALVGRSEELRRLDAVLDALGQDGSPSVVDITGEAGGGKTRLLTELCARARKRGLTVLCGRATEYERHFPFRVFADALADAPAAAPDPAWPDDDPALAAAAPLLRGVPDAAAPGADRFAVHRACAALLARLGEDGLVLALDDLHWADPAALELLDHLIRHPVAGRVLVAVARRDRQTPARLSTALARGAGIGTVLALALRPLPERESIAAWAADIPSADARELYAASEGNPLCLLSLLHAYRHGSRPRGGAAGGALAEGVPAALRALFLDELAPLTGTQRLIAEAVAVLGDHATDGMLAPATGVSPAVVEACTAELARRDLLRAGSGGRWTLRHPLLRALVYESMPAGRRARTHRRAAGELARGGAPATERAHHVEKSLTGWDSVAAEVLVEAADRFAPTAPATAAHLLGVVLRLMPDTSSYTRRRGELTLARARALGVGGDLRGSRDLLHALIGAPGAEDALLRADAVALCAAMERHLGHSPEATALLRRELSHRPAPPPRQAVSLGLALGMSALLTGSYAQVRDDVARTVRLARCQGDATDEAAALALAALGEAYEGRIEAAGRFADAAAALADGLTDPRLTDLCESLVWLAWSETLLERYADAERHADRGIAVARRGGRLHVLPHLLTSRALVRLNTCRLPSALESAREAESIARALGSGDLLAFVLSLKALVLLLARPLGDREAVATAEEAVAAAGPGSVWWASLARCMLAQTVHVAGDPHRARETLLRAGGGPGLERLQPTIRPAQLETLTNAALAVGDTAEATRWAARAAAEADSLGLRGQRAAALRAEGVLAERRGDTAAAARLFGEAAGLYARSGAALWEAYSLLRTAPLVKADGDWAGAAVMWRRGRRLAEEGGARLLVDMAELLDPGVPGTGAGPPPRIAALTARELQVARLVAEGLSNQAVAAELRVSHRTVETHLSAIYRKTALPSRSALAGFMVREAAAGPPHRLFAPPAEPEGGGRTGGGGGQDGARPPRGA